jgi:hypothetical protein
MTSRLGSAALWAAAGFLLGAAALAGGDGDDDLREKLIELETLSARLRALDAGQRATPAPDEQGQELDCVHVGDLAAGVPEFCRPQRAGNGAILRTGPLEEAVQPYGTIEEIIEMVRTRVHPQAAAAPGARSRTSRTST